MNTQIWGPPLWHILHTASFRVGREDTHRCADFMNVLQVALPCKFCRESYTRFYHEELGGDAGLTEAIELGQFPQFIYRLHELVNAKLDQQREGKLCHHLSFECLAKRHIATCNNNIRDEAIWDVLLLFAMNASTAERMSAFWEFARALIDFSKRFTSPHLAASLERLELCSSATQHELFCTIVCACYERDVSAEECEAVWSRLAVAVASSCIDGSCI